MYFPFLRAKQFELIALREVADLLETCGKVLPIIEPVRKKTAGLAKLLKNYCKRSLKTLLIVNPNVGELKVWGGTALAMSSEVQTILKLGEISNDCIPTFQIQDYSSASDIQQFFSYYPSRPIAIIHYYNFHDTTLLLEEIRKHGNVQYNCFIEGCTSKAYRKYYSDFGPVEIADGFNKRRKNNLYPKNEFFSDAYMNFKEENIGFGDFLIVGDEWNEDGGPAYTIAIHLTYKDDDTNVWIKHFLSDSNQDDPANPAGKFGEAVKKASDWINAIGYNSAPFSGCIEFNRLNSSKSYPGLGVAKKISMMHHIELMTTII